MTLFRVYVRLYSHLSYKLEVTLIDFEKKNPPSTHIYNIHVYWFLRFFPSSTPRLLHLCISFFQKIASSTFFPTSTFIDIATFASPPPLFQPPWLRDESTHICENYNHIRISHWHHTLADGAKFWISSLWLDFLTSLKVQRADLMCDVTSIRLRWFSAWPISN